MNSSQRKHRLRDRIASGEYMPKGGLLKFNDKAGKYATLADAVVGKRVEQVAAGTHVDRTEHVWTARKNVQDYMLADLYRGQRRQKKIHDVTVRPGAPKPPQALTTTRDLRREYHFAPGNFSAQALTKF